MPGNILRSLCGSRDSFVEQLANMVLDFSHNPFAIDKMADRDIISLYASALNMKEPAL